MKSHLILLLAGATAVMANAVPSPAPTPPPLLGPFINTPAFPYALEKRAELEKRQNCGVMCNSTSCCGLYQECYKEPREDDWRCRVSGIADLSSALNDLSDLLTATEYNWFTGTATQTKNPYLTYDLDMYNSIYSSLMAQYTSGLNGNQNQLGAYSSLLAAAATATDLSSLESILGKANTNSSNKNSDGSRKKKSNTTAIIGGVVGGVAVILIIVAIVCIIMYRRRKAKKKAELASSVAVTAEQPTQYVSVVPEKQNNQAQLPPASVSPLSATGVNASGYYPPPGSPPPQSLSPNSQQYMPSPPSPGHPGAQYFANPPPPPPVPEPHQGASELPEEGVPIQQQQQYIQQIKPHYPQGGAPEQQQQQYQQGSVVEQWTGSTVARQALSEVHGESAYQPPVTQTGHGYYEMDGSSSAQERR